MNGSSDHRNTVANDADVAPLRRSDATVASLDDTLDSYDVNFHAVLRDITELSSSGSRKVLPTDSKRKRATPAPRISVIGVPTLVDDTSAANNATMNYIWTLNSVKRSNRNDRRALLSSQRMPSFLRQSFKSLATSSVATGMSSSIELGNAAAAVVAPTSPGGGDAMSTESTPLVSGSGEKGKLEQHIEKEDESDACFTTTEIIMNLFFARGLLSWCLLAGPLSVWAVHHEWSATIIFWSSFVAMIPLAAILGDFTEEVALHTNDVTGGLINASFGNAVEVVVVIQALLANEIRVVQASMLGSIFSNLLLVLGCCFFFGGLYHKEQTFNATAATANIGLLALSSIAMVLPTPFAEYYDLHDEHVLIVGRIAAIFLMFMYVQLLVFQLHTHADLFNSSSDDDLSVTEMASMSLWTACCGLCGVTLLVTLFSHFLVNSIEGFTEASGVSRTFVGLIILPIVGNAVEHVSAISVATKNKMDLAMGIAVGSCTQISLFVVPLSVLLGWAFGKDMTLNFPHFEVVLYVLSVFTVSVVCSNPICNWLSGSMLITTYCLIAVGFWFEHVVNFE